MSEELRVEFKVAFSGRRAEAKPVPEPGAKAERVRVDRAARRARNLALAHYIDSLIRSGEVADLAGVARMCGVSRARVSQVVALLGMAGGEQEHLSLRAGCAPLESGISGVAGATSESSRSVADRTAGASCAHG